MTPTEITAAYEALGRAIAARARWAALVLVPRGEGVEIALVLDGVYSSSAPETVRAVMDAHSEALAPVLVRAAAAARAEDEARFAPTAESHDGAERLAALALSRDDLNRLDA